MILSYKYKFLFIHVPKTAGCSIDEHVRPLLDRDDLLIEWGRENERFRMHRHHLTRHVTASTARDCFGNRLWNAVYKFAVVRNPFDRLISLHNYYQRSPENLFRGRTVPFNCFIMEPERYFPTCLSAFHYYTPSSGEKRTILDRILRYENLHTELGEVFESLGIPYGGTLAPKRNTEQRYMKDYRACYSKEARAKVEAECKDELDFFNYEF